MTPRSRHAIVQFIYRYSSFYGIDPSIREILIRFETMAIDDFFRTSDYYKFIRKEFFLLLIPDQFFCLQLFIGHAFPNYTISDQYLLFLF